MENMIDFVNGLVSTIAYNESLASMLKAMLQDTKKKPFVGNYYNLTELCNPSQAYWTRISPKIEKSIALQKKLNWGTELHKVCDAWLKTFPDFAISEGTLDGAWVGIPGVRGRIDCRIGESIFEIKTKEKLLESTEELLPRYPHDVEQIAFYSVIHPCHDKINYIISIKDSSPFELKVFKIEIKDPNRVKSLMKSRMKLLDRALEEKNPISCGRCRYFGAACQFQDANLCNCEKLEPLSIEQLELATEITYDEDMTKKLEETRKKYHSSRKFFSTLNIISPRKHKYDIKSEWIPNKEKDESKSYLGALIKKLPIRLSLSERENIFNSSLEPRLHVPYRWVNLKTSMNQDSPVVPYIIKANMLEDAPARPNEYFIAELGLILANYGKTKGLIFIICPKKDNFVQVFEVTYKKTNEILNKTREIIDNLEKSEKDLFTLPPCPSFMNDKGACSLMDECHSRKGFGCVKWLTTPKKTL